MAHNPIYCALDTSDFAEAERIAKAISPHVGGLKLGLQFFMAYGRAGVEALATQGLPIFLDLKFHDIPNTVAKAIGSLEGLPIRMLTVHASGGREMLSRAAEAAARLSARPLVIAVTVLTSLDSQDLKDVGQTADVAEQAVCLASLTRSCGVDGVVCSPQEIGAIRQICGADFHLVVPGIRPEDAPQDDQKRTLTPRQALQLGASSLVIGRPITATADPAQAAADIALSLQSAARVLSPH